MRGHQNSIVALAASKSYSIIVSSGKDSACMIWDLNRYLYSRSLTGHEEPAISVSINDNTGDIMTSTSSTCRVWTINGELLISKNIYSSVIPDAIFSSAFYEGKTNEIFNTIIVITGHVSGRIRIWKVIFRNEKTRANVMHVKEECLSVQNKNDQASLDKDNGLEKMLDELSESNETNVKDGAERFYDLSQNICQGKWDLELHRTLIQTEGCPITYIYFPPSMRYMLTGDNNGEVYGWM